MFEKEQQQIIESLNSQGSSKSWIVIGPKGIGKEDFAKNLVKVLTHDFNEYNPNVQWISCGLTETAKKEIQKAILAGETPEDKEWAKKTEITVDDVRDGCHFLSLKSNKIKILVFNLADDMNENAQNALLKTLEEPYSNTLILLLCENIGKLVPTILSRCQKLRLIAPDKSEFKKQLVKKYPDLTDVDLEELSFLSDNVFGFADELVQQDGLMLYANLKEILVPLNQLNARDLLLVSEKMTKDKDVYDLTKRLLLKLLVALTKSQTNCSLEKAYLLSELYEKTKSSFAQIDSMNLDKKQALISIIYQIAEVL